MLTYDQRLLATAVIVVAVVLPLSLAATGALAGVRLACGGARILWGLRHG